jgi:hypothetical protein
MHSYISYRRHPEPVLAKNTESLGIKAITLQLVLREV